MKEEKEKEKEKAGEKKKSGRMAKDWLRSFMEYSRGTESPPLFYWWSGVSILAGALQRRVYFSQGILRKLYPSFYIVLVAPPGGRKGQPVDVAGRFLRHVGVNILHGTSTPEGLMFQLRASNKPFRKSEKREPLTDAKKPIFIPECIGFIQAEELSSLFGKRNYVDDLITFLTDSWDCHDHWDYTTKTGGKVPINKIYINLLGASNPEWLGRCFREDAFGGGFMGRTIFVYQDEFGCVPPSKLVKSLHQEELELVLQMDLDHISRLEGVMDFDSESGDFLDKWYIKQKKSSVDRLARYFRTKHVHLLKLAMILSVSECDDLVVRKKHIEKAIKMLESTEVNMTKAFAYVGVTNEAKVAQLVLDFVEGQGGVTSQTALTRHVRKYIKSRKELFGILDTLYDSKMLEVNFDKKKKVNIFSFPSSYVKERLKERQETWKDV